MMKLEWQHRHKKLLSWKKLIGAYHVMKKAEANPHYWIEEQNRRIPEFVMSKRRLDLAVPVPFIVP